MDHSIYVSLNSEFVTKLHIWHGALWPRLELKVLNGMIWGRGGSKSHSSLNNEESKRALTPTPLSPQSYRLDFAGVTA